MSLRVRSYRRVGRLVPRRDHGLRASSVRLAPGGVMAWHSTGAREELLIVLEGRVVLEVEAAKNRVSRRAITSGSCAWLPTSLVHQVINRSRRSALYLYVTAQCR